MANSGDWRKSKWPDGRVAGWANLFIRNFAWRKEAWINSAFQDSALEKFIEEHVDGKSTHKVFTNYRFMLRSAGVVVGGELQPFDFTERWFIDATQLFWDRQIFDGALHPSNNMRAYEDLFSKHEVHKLLACSENQGRAFIAVAFREYSSGRMAQRFDQIRTLQQAGLFAA